MHLWAFCTSPHGLGLSDLDFWCLSFREINALRAEYDKSIWRWAHQQAALYNSNTRLDLHGVMWVAEDFLVTGNRERRLIDAKRTAEQTAKDKRDEDFLNFQLFQIQKGKGPGKNIPFWARKDWDGTVPEEYKQRGQRS